ncbi:MAG: hypothetical protein D6722_12600 [Bacteroidetes bacterium]|nr:MAG: hypothetical protein D6722_12600 [Bacteroidota bacterium]
MGTLQAGAQQVIRTSDTLWSDGVTTHMYLNIEVPSGELFLRNSGTCGMSVSHLVSPDSQIRHRVERQHDRYGNEQRVVYFHPQRPTPPDAHRTHRLTTNSLQLADQLSHLDTYVREERCRSEYIADPTISTDLALNLGVGATRLDLSGLTLRNLSINSAFSDVVVMYTEPNQIEMEKMDIHAAKGDIFLKYLELARAKLVTVRNDMGETTLILGGSRPAPSTIYLQSGVGGCTLIVDEDQPVRVVLRTGMFVEVEAAEGFQVTDKHTLVNAAYQRKPEQATSVICTADFGTISLIEH